MRQALTEEDMMRMTELFTTRLPPTRDWLGEFYNGVKVCMEMGIATKGGNVHAARNAVMAFNGVQSLEQLRAGH